MFSIAGARKSAMGSKREFAENGPAVLRELSFVRRELRAPIRLRDAAQSVFKTLLRSRLYVISKEAPHRTIGSHEILRAD